MLDHQHPVDADRVASAHKSIIDGPGQRPIHARGAELSPGKFPSPSEDHDGAVSSTHVMITQAWGQVSASPRSTRWLQSSPAVSRRRDGQGRWICMGSRRLSRRLLIRL
jgi:hypothetical protein